MLRLSNDKLSCALDWLPWHEGNLEPQSAIDAMQIVLDWLDFYPLVNHLINFRIFDHHVQLEFLRRVDFGHPW